MIVFAWDGFPQYAARCVGALVRAAAEPVCVVATRPQVPIEGMERVAGCPVRWVAADAADVRVAVDASTVLFVSGWFVPAFNRLAARVRQTGGRVICMIDNDYRLSFVELAKAIRFRLKMRGRFDGFFVPGRSGRRLLRLYGVSAEKIRTGLYAADETLFRDGGPLGERPKRIVYVGQFIERKNVRRLVRAFLARRGVGWQLHLYGSGELRGELEAMAACSQGSVRVQGFLQPEALAEAYRRARVFCLPSAEEHWGLVVHEAALSGCVLCLSRAVGAAVDLVGRGNGFMFGPGDETALGEALARAMAMSDAALAEARRESRRMAAGAGLGQFVSGAMALARAAEKAG